MRCAAITKGGSRCKLEATHASYCYQHSPDTAQERKRRASKGGKAGGNGRAGISELATIKRELHAVIAGVLSGRVERGRGAVAFQGYNALLKAVETERRIRETEDLEARIEALERAQAGTGGRRWGT
jgi:uncharacterized protein DUF5763